MFTLSYIIKPWTRHNQTAWRVNYLGVFLFFFCDVVKLDNSSQEDLATFGYSLDVKVELLFLQYFFILATC
jgi:hypothetical protein